jgi:biopolymer transport protein ExbD
MGGSSNIGEPSENPVEINVTAMVDVIFCLCIFFMCSFHFKQVQGKIDAWLPDHGHQNGPVDHPPPLEEIRVFLRWDPSTGSTLRKVGSRAAVGSDAELLDAIRAMKADYDRAQKPEAPVLIDSTPEVPWNEVVHLLDLLKVEKLSKIEFVEPMEVAGRSQSR